MSKGEIARKLAREDASRRLVTRKIEAPKPKPKKMKRKPVEIIEEIADIPEIREEDLI